MSDSPDTSLQLKKKARRRLVGAIAFAGLAAVVLPMIMDEEPKQQIQDVQIRIPGQDQEAFTPKLPEKPAELAISGEEAIPVEPAPVAKVEKGEPIAVKPAEKSAEKSAEKPAEKPTEKSPEKSPEKPAEKAPETTKAKSPEKDQQRAAAILSGKTVEPLAATPAKSLEQFVILIGAFSNPDNVKQLQSKIGELGVKVFTEPLDSPGGRKTRVRAGPFPSREAAEKALGKLKKIGVNGIVAAK